jgi:hypothetical protein
MMMNMDARPPDAGDFGWSTLLEPIEAPETCGGVIGGTTGAGFFVTTFLRWGFFFGFAWCTTGFLMTGLLAWTTVGARDEVAGALDWTGGGVGVGFGVGRGCGVGVAGGFGLGFG